MSQAVTAEPSALCKLKQRDRFPPVVGGDLSAEGDGHPEGRIRVRRMAGRLRWDTVDWRKMGEKVAAR